MKIGLKILSCGAGMQSTALVLMSCENKMFGNIHPGVPIYDYVFFCDLGEEPPWVYSQVDFIKKACEEADIPFIVIGTHLFAHYMERFGKERCVSIPFWTITPEGKNSKMMRTCTLEYKIYAIQKYVRENILGYNYRQKTKDEDKKAHEMHIGFSVEEKSRCSDNPHPMFSNHFPLVEMNLERKDNYAYIKDVWGLRTKASACNICPFHRNYFFKHLKDHHQDSYNKLVEFDDMLEREQPNTLIESKLFISRSRKRIKDLCDHECDDAEYFPYKDEMKWNGF